MQKGTRRVSAWQSSCAQLTRPGPLQHRHSERHAQRAADEKWPQPTRFKRPPQLPDRYALHEETETDNQSSGVVWGYDVQPCRCCNQPKSKTGEAGHQRCGKRRQEKNGKLGPGNAIHGSHSRTGSGSSAGSSSGSRAGRVGRSRLGSATTCARSTRAARPPSSGSADPRRPARSAPRHPPAGAGTAPPAGQGCAGASVSSSASHRFARTRSACR